MIGDIALGLLVLAAGVRVAWHIVHGRRYHSSPPVELCASPSLCGRPVTHHCDVCHEGFCDEHGHPARARLAEISRHFLDSGPRP